MLFRNRGRQLLLRPIEPDDADWLFWAYADAAFARLYRANMERESPDQIRSGLAERYQRSPAEVGSIEYVAVHPELGRVGLAAIVDYSSLHRRAEFLVGIVRTELRHSRLAVEATLLTLDLAFNHYGIQKLYTYVYGYNDYAEKNTQKVGFRQEGVLKSHHFCSHENRFIDLYMNGMTEDDFRASEPLARLSQRLVGRNITLPIKIQTLGPAQELAAADLAVVAERLRQAVAGNQ